MQPLYLEDISVGQRFTSEPYIVTRDDIIAFARQFDPQPFHLNDEAAEKSFFGTLVASGWHTGALTMKLIVASVPFSGGVIGAGGELSWLKPVRPGDTLHVESEVLALTGSKSKPGRAVVTLQTHTLNQAGEKVQTLVARLLAFSKNAS